MRNPDSLTQKTNEDTPQGLAFAITAYGLWGFLPIYMKWMAHIPVLEVLVHRVIWSVPIAAAVLIALRRTAALREALRNPQMLMMGGVTAALISITAPRFVWSTNLPGTLCSFVTCCAFQPPTNTRISRTSSQSSTAQASALTRPSMVPSPRL